MNILIVEDEHKMRIAIKKYMLNEGYEVFEACDGKEALEKFFDKKIDFVLLDVMLPKLDGWSVLRRIREESNVPVIMVSARGEEYDRLFGFELGVDDYITKPFSPKELIARIKAINKRMNLKGLNKNNNHIIEFENLKVNINSNEVFLANFEIKLTPKEYSLLIFLMQNNEMVFSREQLLNKVWGYDFYGDLRTVDTHIKQLRDKLGQSKHMIATVWGKGYKFKGDKN
ncbi:MAG: response regulator transcription factor [Peptostreptococcaceae bacterium]|jgi:two-component system response regulator ResD|nr:response regulator transcription factor [Peptostreptococcaceae bacterium]